MYCITPEAKRYYKRFFNVLEVLSGVYILQINILNLPEVEKKMILIAFEEKRRALGKKD